MESLFTGCMRPLVEKEVLIFQGVQTVCPIPERDDTGKTKPQNPSFALKKQQKFLLLKRSLCPAVCPFPSYIS